jgi:hypothetical protein
MDCMDFMDFMDFTERTVIDGKPATVCYLDAARMPTTPDKATMMEVRFDNGDTMFAVVKPKAPDPT